MGRTLVANTARGGYRAFVLAKQLSRSRWIGATLVVGLAATGLSATAQPAVVDVIPITGAPTMLLPTTTVANLDRGLRVAGFTRWDHDNDGIIFNETFVGFLWTPEAGAVGFPLNDQLYFEEQFQQPTAIAEDNTVIGTLQFRRRIDFFPFVSFDGLSIVFLPLPGVPPGASGIRPPASGWVGKAVVVSADAMTIAGTVQEGAFSDVPTFAATWVGRSGHPHRPYQRGAQIVGPRLDAPSNLRTSSRRYTLRVLDAAEPFSQALGISADGTVVVGHSGPERTRHHATRWVDGTEQLLEVVGRTSTALFTSADGTTAVGLADTASGSVLVRWDAAGAASVILPPAGLSFASINAINPQASAVVGAISENGNDAPFLWRVQDGLTIFGELGREADYDMSAALDVSDEGTIVVGTFKAGTIFNGDPPTLGWIWTDEGGLLLLDDLLMDAGHRFSVSEASTIAGDGSAVWVSGSPNTTIHDSFASILTLTYP